jgi:hypothetical protein
VIESRCSASRAVTGVLGGRARRWYQEAPHSLRPVRPSRPQLRRQGRACLPPLQGAPRRMLACRQTAQGRSSGHARVRPPSARRTHLSPPQQATAPFRSGCPPCARNREHWPIRTGGDENPEAQDQSRPGRPWYAYECPRWQARTRGP